jgi:hypothetical protein
MAKKKPEWITCASYTLDARNSNTAFLFDLVVNDKDDNEYTLKVKQLNDRTRLVQQTLRVMADRWPAFDWEFQADGDGEMTDIR